MKFFLITLLKLRHELIPYLYTMNYRSHAMDELLVQPLYYNWTESEARAMKNEYTFGTEMLVSPITSPADRETGMGSVKTYLPEGVWYDFFHHLRYHGGRTVTMFRSLYEMPVLVKSGGIIPMAKLTHINDVENPESMKIKVFAGSDNTFELYEDDGVTNGFQKGESVITKMELKWGENAEFSIFAPEGELSLIPEKRNFEMEFVGVNGCTEITVTENGITKAFRQSMTENTINVLVEDVSGELKVSLKHVQEDPNNALERIYGIIKKHEHIPNDAKGVIQKIVESQKPAGRKVNELAELDLSKNVLLALTEILMAEE